MGRVTVYHRRGLVPAPAQAPLLERFATPHAENQALQARIRALEAQLVQTSANSSRPPSAELPRSPVRPEALPSGRKRGGQPGHRGALRGLLPVERRCGESRRRLSYLQLKATA
jgi:transposase